MTRIAASLIVLAFEAAAQPNLGGVWASRPPDNIRVKIEQQGSSLQITVRATVRDNVEQVSNRFVAGQETQGEMHGAPLKSRTEWDESTLVVRSTAVIANRELRLTDRYSVSADGNALTFDEVSQYGTQPEVHQVHTFDRRPASEWGPDTPPKPAEEVYKNIVIMKGVPAPRLRTVMNNLTKWLGVDCSHCHIAGEFEKDDKPAKQTARKMFQMVRSINQENFAGVNPGVTCWTCHRGAAKPQSLPPE